MIILPISNSINQLDILETRSKKDEIVAIL